MKKKYDFQFQKGFLITFFEGNGPYEAEENNSNGIVCDDDAHKVVFSTCCPFLFTRWILLRLKKMILKIQLTIKGKKLKYKKPPHKKKCEKTQNKSAGPSKKR